MKGIFGGDRRPIQLLNGANLRLTGRRAGLILRSSIAMMRRRRAMRRPATNNPRDHKELGMKNWVLGLILAGVAIFMYVSIFFEMAPSDGG